MTIDNGDSTCPLYPVIAGANDNSDVMKNSFPEEDTVSGGDETPGGDAFLSHLSRRLILSPWQRGLTFFVKKYNIS